MKKKNRKPNGVSQRQAVYDACAEKGDRTSIKDLSIAAAIIYGGNISETSVVTYRSEWRIKNGSTGDCRTYAGQPRRNMQNDETCTLPQVLRLRKFIGKKNGEINRLKSLLGAGKHQFHSVEQLIHAITNLDALQLSKAA